MAPSPRRCESVHGWGWGWDLDDLGVLSPRVPLAAGVAVQLYGRLPRSPAPEDLQVAREVMTSRRLLLRMQWPQGVQVGSTRTGRTVELTQLSGSTLSGLAIWDCLEVGLCSTDFLYSVSETITNNSETLIEIRLRIVANIYQG